jgi:hypothetical protein
MTLSAWDSIGRGIVRPRDFAALRFHHSITSCPQPEPIPPSAATTCRTLHPCGERGRSAERRFGRVGGTGLLDARSFELAASSFFRRSK